VLDEIGCLHSTSKGEEDASSTSLDTQGSRGRIQFTIGAHPATLHQSKALVELCPIENDNDESIIAMTKQTLILPIHGIELTVRSSTADGGGTGSTPWRGGWLLSQQICHWFQKQRINDDANFDSLFRDKHVLELGAGVSALPSMTLAKIATLFNYNVIITSSDGVDEIVSVLRMNIKQNLLHEHIRVEHID
jgi:hypothetical protein